MQKRRYHVGPIVLLLFCGGVFTALGVALVCITVSSIWRAPSVDVATCLMPLIFIVPLLGFGITGLVMGFRMIRGWVKLHQTQRVGEITTARLVDYKVVAHNGRVNKRYALVLEYYVDGSYRTFTTDYIFDINEFKYLSKLKEFKVKVNGNFVSVAEEFRADIYQLDPHYGIEMAFYQQKPVRRILTAWRICVLVGIAWLVVAIILTTTLGESLFLLSAVFLLFCGNFPFAILTAVYLIKWLTRREK